jgi:hypothetical protein
MPLRSRDQGAVHLDDFFLPSMSRTAEEYALKLPPDIDSQSLLWTFKSLDEDGDLEKFFEALPSLYHSETGKDLDTSAKPHQTVLCRLTWSRSL